MNTTITVLTFGVVTEIVGKRNFVMSGVATTEDLQQKLEAEFTGLKNIKYALAVNKQMITSPAQLQNGATVALLPPFSGG